MASNSVSFDTLVNYSKFEDEYAPIRRTSFAMDRRGFVRLFATSAMAFSLGLLGLLPPARRALASSESNNAQTGCSGIMGGDYNDQSASHGCCLCGSNVSSGHCHSGSPGKWHRHDSLTGSGYTIQYFLRPTSCNGKNNWTWPKSGQTWRCADGWYRIWVPGYPYSDHLTVCPSTI